MKLGTTVGLPHRPNPPPAGWSGVSLHLMGGSGQLRTVLNFGLDLRQCTWVTEVRGLMISCVNTACSDICHDIWRLTKQSVHPPPLIPNLKRTSLLFRRAGTQRRWQLAAPHMIHERALYSRRYHSRRHRHGRTSHCAILCLILCLK